jgi:uncharacterized protein YggT (Ycf19 family)
MLFSAYGSHFISTTKNEYNSPIHIIVSKMATPIYIYQRRFLASIAATLIGISSIVALSCTFVNKLNSMPQTIGTTTGLTTWQNYPYVYGAIVKYNYTVNEILFKGTYDLCDQQCATSPNYSYAKQYRTGSSIVVFYKEINPSENSLFSFELINPGIKVGIAIFVVFTVIFLGITSHLFIKIRRHL